ncbi:MAG: hypothetical protein UFD80_08990, partial [Blautia sp.]|uniref:hypothetical protein n=1 Tax=Blautia sp. TaxID=1955243 RepID=UPI002E765CDE
LPVETVDLIVVTASVARTVYHNRTKKEKEILSMSSILRNKNIPMSFVLVELLFLLLRIIPIEEFDESGKKTGRIIGYAYDCVDTMNFDHFRIKIKGQAVPLMSNEDLQKLREQGQKITVEFTDPTVLMYWSDKTKTYEDSFSAKDVALVETEI